MRSRGSALLEFNPELKNLSKGKELRDGLSAVVQVGDTLWVANDETISLERLSLQQGSAGGDYRYSEHRQFALTDYLRLPVPPPSDPKDIEEVDVEGLDYKDGYLWFVGSHSLKRGNPKEGDSFENNFKRLAKVRRDGNRFLLARIPLVERGGTYTLEKESTQNGKKRIAAQLRGDDKGNDLTKALAKDEHLRYFLDIPGKDNGFDIEGLAVAGERLFIGLRGPVLRGRAVILEVDPKKDNDDSSTLELKKIGSDDRPYRKHFLDLRGLGIRDLCVQASDLLILAGPTMNLDGPVMIFRWPGGAQPKGESLVFAEALPKVIDVPFGQGENGGKDHAEGMTLFSPDGGDTPSVLVVYDAASKSRKDERTSAVRADIFALS